MDFSITDEDRLLQQSVRDFVEDQANAVWQEIETTDKLPQSLIDGARDVGLLGLTIPQEYGGLGLSVVQKTLAQVDGVPASESCLVTCVYRLAASSLAVPSTGGTFSIDVERTSGSCSYVAFSEHDWITMTPPLTGSGRVRQGFTVVSNSADARTGYIRFQYPGGAAYLEVNQGSFTPLSFQFFDLPTTTNPTTECNIRSTATTCTLTATTPTPVAGAIYDWRVEYAYNGSKVKTQTSASPSLRIET